MKKLECILLVDDNVNDNFVHFMTIKETDTTRQIKTARDGKKALEYLDKGKENPNEYPFPDLIFLDLAMPGINGYEFLDKIREKKLSGVEKPVIVIMTGSYDSDTEQKIKDNYSDEVVALVKKPLTVEMQEEIIKTYF
ncbi:response regulator [Mucilaginibacter sp.]|uniref:response regulator n=1 Tax=Mucilaginibacter sp. TaxID=1882438 RepID=UPI003D096BE5